MSASPTRLDESGQQALERRLAHSGIELVRKRFALESKRIGYLIAAPSVLGGLLLGFIVIAWGAFDLIEPSGTTSAALLVAAALILVPALLAAMRGIPSDEHAQEVFEAFHDVLSAADQSSAVETDALAPAGGLAADRQDGDATRA